MFHSLLCFVACCNASIACGPWHSLWECLSCPCVSRWSSHVRASTVANVRECFHVWKGDECSIEAVRPQKFLGRVRSAHLRRAGGSFPIRFVFFHVRPQTSGGSAARFVREARHAMLGVDFVMCWHCLLGIVLICGDICFCHCCPVSNRLGVRGLVGLAVMWWCLSGFSLIALVRTSLLTCSRCLSVERSGWVGPVLLWLCPSHTHVRPRWHQLLAQDSRWNMCALDVVYMGSIDHRCLSVDRGPWGNRERQKARLHFVLRWDHGSFNNDLQLYVWWRSFCVTVAREPSLCTGCLDQSTPTSLSTNSISLHQVTTHARAKKRVSHTGVGRLGCGMKRSTLIVLHRWVFIRAPSGTCWMRCGMSRKSRSWLTRF